MSKQANLSELTEQALAAIAAATSVKDLDVIRVEYLGKKGQLTALLKTLGQLPAEERSAAGATRRALWSARNSCNEYE